MREKKNGYVLLYSTYMSYMPLGIRVTLLAGHRSRSQSHVGFSDFFDGHDWNSVVAWWIDCRWLTFGPWFYRAADVTLWYRTDVQETDIVSLYQALNWLRKKFERTPRGFWDLAPEGPNPSKSVRSRKWPLKSQWKSS